MTVLCSGDCHVYRANSLRCTCGAAANGYPSSAMMFFPGYNPYGPRAPKPDPPVDVPLSRLQAARAVNATHLSADGETAYDERQLGVWYCDWKEEENKFGSWYKILCGILPPDAVKME